MTVFLPLVGLLLWLVIRDELPHAIMAWRAIRYAMTERRERPWSR